MGAATCTVPAVPPPVAKPNTAVAVPSFNQVPSVAPLDQSEEVVSQVPPPSRGAAALAPALSQVRLAAPANGASSAGVTAAAARVSQDARRCLLTVRRNDDDDRPQTRS